MSTEARRKFDNYLCCRIFIHEVNYSKKKTNRTSYTYKRSKEIILRESKDFLNK